MAGYDPVKLLIVIPLISAEVGAYTVPDCGSTLMTAIPCITPLTLPPVMEERVAELTAYKR